MRQIDQEYLRRERVHLGALVDHDDAVALARLARENERSMSAEVRLALARHLELERSAVKP